ncbi:DUF4272 domain-containing protein [Oxalobacteraceae bacterium]|nr:DUF4272 domain-containing protein [Oxalobacteraceae bacterium]
MKFPAASIFCLSLFMSAAHAAEPKYSTVPESAFQGLARTSLDSPQPTEEQLRRKKKFTDLVAAIGAPINKSLPVVEDVGAIRLRSADEVAGRALAVTIAAMKASGMAHEDITQLVKQWQIYDYLSPQELAFIQSPQPAQADLVKFSWRYEGLEVLLWALGYKTQLPSPNGISDAGGNTEFVAKNHGPLLAKNAKPRTASEILDMADYYYRLHWSAVELRLQSKVNPSINEEIIMERHFALNWLIRYLGKDWDNMTTDT